MNIFKCHLDRLRAFGRTVGCRKTDYELRLKYLADMSGLEIRMWVDPKQQEKVYAFRNGGGEVIRVYGYKKAKVFAKGVKYGREHSKQRKP